ncbi:glycosyl transferase family 1 [Mycolicibacterium smegmatis]|uniref:Colanic acid biosynthesis glycosyl transferase wcaI n=1 Tax=Mycolicibacterium smegmatis (strain ATCC 700084 / mc(2)155) TaxID=246196 RepID=I7G9F7_MYCS2|nr:Putative colanic acid biosynthesis glycosyl transferase wcaI [Mycolicibacterium smegmatis MC2 155]AIU10965.1 glycosyl transferase family 1 [Mycolicibacterium smegmatis MC2 155]AIU17589.1 glycosyl transferase family 1 [Mycolicibacterium smegmatis]AIU24213.1 glycosyl transferase family 1 [Mycolicibacterium smegmatis]
MRVAILGINYAPEPTGIAPYTTGLAKGLIDRGHDVRVLTGFPHYPQWRRDKTRSGFRWNEQIDGVPVFRLSHPVPQRLSWRGRAAMEITFGLQLMTSRWGRPEVVVCVTPPLLAATMAAVRARVSWPRPAIGMVVQDLYSRGVTETGAASGLSASAISHIESSALRLADGVAVIHPGFASQLSGHLGVQAHRIRVIRNWTHVPSPDPMSSEAFRASHGWGSDELIILHAGNMGFKQGLENVIAAAELAGRADQRVRFVLLGDGNQRVHLQSMASGIRAIDFLSPVSDEDFPAALGAADVLLVNERPGVAQMAVPSKLTSYFRAGKPILAATDEHGFAAREIRAARAGVLVDPNRPDLLVQEALRLGQDRSRAAQLGEAGGRYCDEVLSAAAAIDSYEDWIVGLAESIRRAGGGKSGKSDAGANARSQNA